MLIIKTSLSTFVQQFSTMFSLLLLFFFPSHSCLLFECKFSSSHNGFINYLFLLSRRSLHVISCFDGCIAFSFQPVPARHRSEGLNFLCVINQSHSESAVIKISPRERRKKNRSCTHQRHTTYKGQSDGRSTAADEEQKIVCNSMFYGLFRYSHHKTRYLSTSFDRPSPDSRTINILNCL